STHSPLTRLQLKHSYDSTAGLNSTSSVMISSTPIGLSQERVDLFRFSQGGRYLSFRELDLGRSATSVTSIRQLPVLGEGECISSTEAIRSSHTSVGSGRSLPIGACERSFQPSSRLCPGEAHTLDF